MKYNAPLIWKLFFQEKMEIKPLVKLVKSSPSVTDTSWHLWELFSVVSFKFLYWFPFFIWENKTPIWIIYYFLNKYTFLTIIRRIIVYSDFCTTKSALFTIDILVISIWTYQIQIPIKTWFNKVSLRAILDYTNTYTKPVGWVMRLVFWSIVKVISL